MKNKRILLAAVVSISAFGAPLAAQLDFNVIDPGSSQFILWTVRHNNDVLGIDVFGDTFTWDSATLAWNATGASTIAFSNTIVFVTRGTTAAHWDGVQVNEWNGSAWTPVSVAGSSPPSLAFGQSATGLPTGEIVIFSGIDPSTFPATYLADTWVLSPGNIWTQSAPSPSPSPREGGVMTNDSSGNVVLFGGVDSIGNPFADTWEFSSGVWTAQSPATSPPGRSYAAFTFRPSTNSALLFGGIGATPITDAWIYTMGGTWTAASASYTTPASFGSSALHNQTDEVIAGDANLRTFVGTLHGDNQVHTGCNCAGSGGTFNLDSTGVYQPDLVPPLLTGFFALEFSNYQVGTAIFMAFDAATATAPVPIPGFPSGCNLNLNAIAGQVLVDANPPLSPNPVYLVGVPASASVIGARVVYQGYQVNTCVTQALDVRIGR